MKKLLLLSSLLLVGCSRKAPAPAPVEETTTSIEEVRGWGELPDEDVSGEVSEESFEEIESKEETTEEIITQEEEIVKRDALKPRLADDEAVRQAIDSYMKNTWRQLMGKDYHSQFREESLVYKGADLTEGIEQFRFEVEDGSVRVDYIHGIFTSDDGEELYIFGVRNGDEAVVYRGKSVSGNTILLVEDGSPLLLGVFEQFTLPPLETTMETENTESAEPNASGNQIGGED